MEKVKFQNGEVSSCLLIEGQSANLNIRRKYSGLS